MPYPNTPLMYAPSPFFDFSKIAGSIAYDLTGNLSTGTDGTISGTSVTGGQAGPSSSITAARFTGTGQIAFTKDFAGTKQCFSVWIKAETPLLAATQPLIACAAFSLFLGGTLAAGKIGFTLVNGVNTFSIITTAAVISDSNWHLVRVNYKDTPACTIYIDGVSVATTTLIGSATTFPTTTTITLATDGANFFSGYLAAPFFHASLPDASMALNDYNQGITPAYPEVLYKYSFANGLPDNWFNEGTLYTIAAGKGVSGGSALAVSALNSGGNANFTYKVADASVYLANGGNCEMEATVQSGQAGGDGYNSIQMFVQGTDYIVTHGEITGYLVTMNGGASPAFQFYRVLGGTFFELHADIAFTGWSASIWYRLIINTQNTTKKFKIQRLDNNQFLQTNGTWGAGEVFCVTATDALIVGSGMFGISSYCLAGVAMYVDNLKITQLADPGQTYPPYTQITNGARIFDTSNVRISDWAKNIFYDSSTARYWAVTTDENTWPTTIQPSATAAPFPLARSGPTFLYSSFDALNWMPHGAVITPDWTVCDGIQEATLRYNPTTSKYYIFSQIFNRAGSPSSKLQVWTSTAVTGPYTLQTTFVPGGAAAINDFDIFTEAGTTYIIFDTGSTCWIAPFAADWLSVTGHTVHDEFVGREGFAYGKDPATGVFNIFCSGKSWTFPNGNRTFTCDTVNGTYVDQGIQWASIGVPEPATLAYRCQTNRVFIDSAGTTWLHARRFGGSQYNMGDSSMCWWPLAYDGSGIGQIGYSATATPVGVPPVASGGNTRNRNRPLNRHRFGE